MTAAKPRPTTGRTSMLGLYVPVGIVLLALGAWTIWWFILTGQIRTRLENETRRLGEAGWQISHAEPRISGWPFRTRVELRDVSITAPSRHAVLVPYLDAEANAWDPTHWVMAAREGLELDRAGKGKVGIAGKHIRMSASGLGQRWPRLAVELVQPVFTARPGGDPFPFASAERVEFYTRPHMLNGEASPDDLDVMILLRDGRGRPDGPVESFAQEGQLTFQLEGVIGRASTFSGGGAAGLFSTWAGAGGTLRDLRGALKAGDSNATLSSDVLRVDADGRLAGTVTFQARDPGPALAGLAGAQPGVRNRLGAAGAAAVTGAGAAASRVTGQDSLPLTIDFREGRAWLGPFSIAPAPKLF